MGPMSRMALLKFVCLGAFLVGFWLWWWWLFVLGFVVVGVSLVGLWGFGAGRDTKQNNISEFSGFL